MMFSWMVDLEGVLAQHCFCPIHWFAMIVFSRFVPIDLSVAFIVS